MPKNLLSRGFGWLARRRRPRFLVRPFMRWFAGRFGIDLKEAEHPFEEYDCLLALFTRRLRPGLRPVADDPDAVVSPVDARVGQHGRIEEGTLYQAKGMDYQLRDLLGSEAAAAVFEGGAYLTLYLSPRDYHRIHSPAAGEVTRTLYEPGTLWPVNPPAVQAIASLFAVNERATAWLETSSGPIAVVMVGATNVGSIRLAYAEFCTNQGAARQVLTHTPAVPLQRGAHLGTFELGSTVVLLVSARRFRWEGLVEGAWLPFGSVLGRHGGE